MEAAAESSAPSTTNEGFTRFEIKDPNVGDMTAGVMTLPAGWRLQGMVTMSPCTWVPWVSYRAASADGLMQSRVEPVFGWRWHPQVRNGQQLDSGCAPINEQISAAKFLKYYVGTIQGGVHVVGSMPVSAQYKEWADNWAARLNQQAASAQANLRTQFTDDVAALRIEIPNHFQPKGPQVFEVRLRSTVECQQQGGPYPGGVCWARVDVLSAPKGRLDALVGYFDSSNLPRGGLTQEYAQLIMQKMKQQYDQASQQLRAQAEANNKLLREQFEQSMQTIRENGEAFRAQQESQFQSAMSADRAHTQAMTNTASDWTDYALNQYTVLTPAGPAKVPNTMDSDFPRLYGNGQPKPGVVYPY